METKLDKNYKLLAIGIINQAIRDFEFLMNMGAEFTPDRQYKLVSLNEIKHFFYSEWFSLLCSEDGSRVYCRIKENYKKYGRCVPFYEPKEPDRSEGHYGGIKIDYFY